MSPFWGFVDFPRVSKKPIGPILLFLLMISDTLMKRHKAFGHIFHTPNQKLPHLLSADFQSIHYPVAITSISNSLLFHAKIGFNSKYDSRGYLFQRLLKKFPDFLTCIQVCICPTMAAIHNFIQPNFISVDPMDEFVRDD